MLHVLKKHAGRSKNFYPMGDGWAHVHVHALSRFKVGQRESVPVVRGWNVTDKLEGTLSKLWDG